jgi:hypothetical protein
MSGFNCNQVEVAAMLISYRFLNKQAILLALAMIIKHL